MKFLIIRLGSLGDVVLTTPAIKALKDRYPTAIIDFLVKKEYHDLLDGNPHLDRIIILDSRGGHKGLRGLLSISEELRKEGYTHVIDLHGNLRSRMISWLLPGSKTLRYDKQVVKRRLLLSGFKVKTKHTVAAYLEALAPLEIGNVSKIPLNPPFTKGEILSVYLSLEEEKAAKYFLLQHGMTDEIPLVGIAPGAMWPTKRWMEDGFIEVGRRSVKEFGARVVVFGGPDEIELCKRVADGIGKEALSIAGKVGLKETAALINRCKVFVSNDSGPMHLAAAVGTTVVSIFGPTVRGFGFYPLGRNVVVEKKMKCRPCSLHGGNICPKGHFNCMKGITADEVFENVKEMMN